MHCVKCMVDRICVGRDVHSKDHVVDTAAEEFEGNIIVLTPLDNDELVPFGGDTTVPKEKATAQFFYKRKFSIVNGESFSARTKVFGGKSECHTSGRRFRCGMLRARFMPYALLSGVVTLTVLLLCNNVLQVATVCWRS